MSRLNPTMFVGVKHGVSGTPLQLIGSVPRQLNAWLNATVSRKLKVLRISTGQPIHHLSRFDVIQYRGAR